jgi:hypothetical protein
MKTPIKTLSLALLLATGCSAKLQVAVHAYDGPRPIPHTYAIAYANQVLERPPNAALLQEFAATAASDLNKALELGGVEAITSGDIDRITADANANDAPESRTADEAPRGGDAKGNDRAKKPTRGPASHEPGEEVAPAPAIVARQFLKKCTNVPGERSAGRGLDAACTEKFADLRWAVGAENGKLLRHLRHVRDELSKRASRTLSADGGAQDAKIEQELEQSLQAHYRRLRSTGIAANGADEGRVVGTPLFDPMISVLARAPQPVRRTTRAAWVGRMREWVPISHARFNAKGGNAQFVVVREGLLVFRQKSLDFDPTPVVGAGTATAKLGLSVASALMSSYGIPVGGGKGGSESDGATGVSEEDIAAAKETLEARKRTTRAFVGRLANLQARLEKGDLKPEQIKAIRAELAREVQLFQAQLLADAPAGAGQK